MSLYEPGLGWHKKRHKKATVRLGDAAGLSLANASHRPSVRSPPRRSRGATNAARSSLTARFRVFHPTRSSRRQARATERGVTVPSDPGHRATGCSHVGVRMETHQASCLSIDTTLGTHMRPPASAGLSPVRHARRDHGAPPHATPIRPVAPAERVAVHNMPVSHGDRSVLLHRRCSTGRDAPRRADPLPRFP